MKAIKTNKNSNILKVGEVAKMFDSNEFTIREWAREGKIPAKKIGQQWFFHLEVITKFFE